VLGCVGERRDALAAEGLGQADRLAAGGAQMGVVHEAVNGGGGKGFGHQLVETNWGSHAFVLTVRPSEQAVLVCSEDR